MAKPDNIGMQPEMGGGEAGGLTRRQLIIRGAIAGGLVWAAPVVESTVAFATQGGTERPCARYHAVRVNKSGAQVQLLKRKHGDWVAADGQVCYQISDFAGEVNQDVEFEFPGPGRNPQLIQSQDKLAWAVLLPASPVQGQDYRFIIGTGRTSKGRCCEGYVDPNPPNPAEAGRRIIFPQCGDGQLVNVQLIYCAP